MAMPERSLATARRWLLDVFVHLADVFRFDDGGLMIEGSVIGKGDLQLALVGALSN